LLDIADSSWEMTETLSFTDRFAALFRVSSDPASCTSAGREVTAVPSPDGPVTVGARPEHLQLHSDFVEGTVPARVDFVEPLGSHVLVTAQVEARGDGVLSTGDQVPVIVSAPAGTELASGARIGLALPQERTYYFDAETGDARRTRELIEIRSAG
jgi:sn-glycerol 3-phosphate transport system ATP-binding protein